MEEQERGSPWNPHRQTTPEVLSTNLRFEEMDHASSISNKRRHHSVYRKAKKKKAGIPAFRPTTKYSRCKHPTNFYLYQLPWKPCQNPNPAFTLFTPLTIQFTLTLSFWRQSEEETSKTENKICLYIRLQIPESCWRQHYLLFIL